MSKYNAHKYVQIRIYMRFFTAQQRLVVCTVTLRTLNLSLLFL